jgi:hypothetical protein
MKWLIGLPLALALPAAASGTASKAISIETLARLATCKQPGK